MESEFGSWPDMTFEQVDKLIAYMEADLRGEAPVLGSGPSPKNQIYEAVRLAASLGVRPIERMLQNPMVVDVLGQGDINAARQALQISYQNAQLGMGIVQ